MWRTFFLINLIPENDVKYTYVKMYEENCNMTISSDLIMLIAALRHSTELFEHMNNLVSTIDYKYLVILEKLDEHVQRDDSRILREFLSTTAEERQQLKAMLLKYIDD